MYKIAFLLDSSNNWIEKYVRSYIFETEQAETKYSFGLFYESDMVKQFDVVFVLGYTKILSEEFLKQNGLNLVVHESELPAGKGFSPMQWQILQGKNRIKTCLIEMVSKVDSGDIIEDINIELTGYELLNEIRDKQAEATCSLIKIFLTRYPVYQRRTQIGEETFFKRRTIKDDELNVDKTLKEQFNHFRIADNENYPLYFEIDGHKYYVKIYNQEK